MKADNRNKKKELEKKVSINGEEYEKNDVTFEEEPDAIEEEEGGSKDKLHKLKIELKKCRNEKAEYLDGWQKAKSDLVNIRRRYEKEAREAGERSERKFAESILPVLDSFKMATANSGNWEELPKEWKEGMENVLNQLIKILNDKGIYSFSPIDQNFDPCLHEAVGTVKVEDKSKDNIIVEVIQDGYMIRDQLLRCAKVRVGEYLNDNEDEVSAKEN